MPLAGWHPLDPAAPMPETVHLVRVALRAQTSGCPGIRVMRARLRPLSGGLCRGHAQLGQEAAVVGLHPLLCQPALVVVPEGTDHFPLEVLTGRPYRTNGRVGKDPSEVTGERGARRQEP